MNDRELMQQALEALATAEAGLADIGDADREPGDDVAWCEARAAQALATPRKAIAALRERLAQQGEPLARLSITGAPGGVLGAPYPDWPEWCQTFNERRAYQQGVGDAREHAKITATEPTDVEAAPAPQAQQGEPVKPDAFQHEDDDDTWRDVPDDCDIIERAGGTELKVGDEYECQVCWTGRQRFRVTKVADNEDDDYKVELIHSSRTLYAAPQVQQPLTDEQAKKLCKCGPVYAPDGKVERHPISYQRELQAAMLLGLRKGEAAHGIGAKPDAA